jgi:hypothetical protein
MPLARILTRNPERTSDLSSQLKQQGYSVEVARPDQTNLAPADLEIEFEVCERADVLDRAADLATELGADVAVAPGVLQMAPKPAAEPIMYGSTAPQLAPPETAMPQQVLAQPAPENVMHAESQLRVERDPERDFEAAFAPVIEMPASMPASSILANKEEIDAPVMEQEPMPPVAFMDETPAAAPIAAAPIAEYQAEKNYAETQPAEHAIHEPIISSQPVRAADPMPYLAQLTPFSGRTNRTVAEREEKKQNAASAASREDHPQVPERGKKILQDGARVAAQTWASALGLAASTSASVRDHFAEYRKRAQVRSAEARAEHAARLLDLEQRRAEAHQRAAELEVAREQAAARLMELVRQREPGLPPERVRESMPFEPAVPAQPSSNYAQRPPAQERRREAPPVAASKREPAVKSARATTPIQLWRSIHPPLRPILTGAAAVTALFIVGIALGLFHSSPPPMASTTTHPGNGVTVQTGVQNGGVTVQAGSAKSQPAQPAAATAEPKPQPGQPAQQTQSAGTAAKPSPAMRQTRLVAEQSEKQIGDDVVIRHYSRPVPTQKPKQSGQQAGLKHFSDLEN